MRVEQLENDIFVVQGRSYQSLATVFLDGDRALLVDCLADRHDAEALRGFVETICAPRSGASSSRIT